MREGCWLLAADYLALSPQFSVLNEQLPRGYLTEWPCPVSSLADRALVVSKGYPGALFFCYYRS